MAINSLERVDWDGRDISTSESFRTKVDAIITEVNAQETAQDALVAKNTQEATIVSITSGSEDIADTDGIALCDASGGNIAPTLPTLDSVEIGHKIVVIAMDITNTITITSGATADKINGADTLAMVTQYDAITVEKVSTTLWSVVSKVLNA